MQLRQLSAKLIGENMFYMKAHRLSIVLHLNPNWSNCEFTRRPVFSLVLRVIFPELLTSGQLHYSDVMILFDLYIIFEIFLKL